MNLNESLGLNDDYIESGLYLTPSALNSYENLSPFELKAKFMEQVRKEKFGRTNENLTFLDGSRGNPNWMCMIPRRAYALFGTFAMNVSTQIGHYILSSTIPEQKDIFSKFLDFLEVNDEKKEISSFRNHSIFTQSFNENEIRDFEKKEQPIHSSSFDEHSFIEEPKLDTKLTTINSKNDGCYTPTRSGTHSHSRLHHDFIANDDQEKPQDITNEASESDKDSIISSAFYTKPTINNYFYDLQTKKYSKMPAKNNPNKIYLSQNKQNNTGELSFILDAFELFPDFRKNADEFIYEMVISYLGCLYCSPSRCLKYTQIILEKFLKSITNINDPSMKFKIFPVEGATAGIVYSLNSLMINGFLHENDKVALLTPSFPPYIEILKMLKMKVIEISLEDYEIIVDNKELMQKKFEVLNDPEIKLFAMVDPGNPSSCSLGKNACDVIATNILNNNPELIVLTDIVYSTFLHEKYHSILSYKELIKNCIIVYSYSKMYGATGMRLGFIACLENTLMDAIILRNGTGDNKKQLPSEHDLEDRYETISLKQRNELKFIDRLTADSRMVALNHTAGLSGPQQLMAVFFSLYTLTDKERFYKKHVLKILQRRYTDLKEGLGIPLGLMFLNSDENNESTQTPTLSVLENDDLDIYKSPRYTRYYITIDLKRFITKFAGAKTFKFVETYYRPLNFVINLFRDHQIVVLPGKNFGAQQWSLRISLANLPDKTYITIGKKIRAVTSGFVEVYFFQQRIMSDKLLKNRIIDENTKEK